jgi:hypothetical protein
VNIHSNRKSVLQMFSIVVLILSVQDAHAYLDPGTGSLMIQALIAGFIGASFYIVKSWGKLKSFFSKRFGGGDDEE